MRAFVCLITQSDNGDLDAFAICAHDRATALASAIEMLTAQPDRSSQVVGILSQEEVTGFGMILAASRACLPAMSSIQT